MACSTRTIAIGIFGVLVLAQVFVHLSVEGIPGHSGASPTTNMSNRFIGVETHRKAVVRQSKELDDGSIQRLSGASPTTNMSSRFTDVGEKTLGAGAQDIKGFQGHAITLFQSGSSSYTSSFVRHLRRLLRSLDVVKLARGTSSACGGSSDSDDAILRAIQSGSPYNFDCLQKGQKIRIFKRVEEDNLPIPLHMIDWQYPHPIVIAFSMVQCRHVAKHFRAHDAWIIPVGYLVAETYLAVLHRFFDNLHTKDSRLPLLRKMAADFQHHHRYPTDVLFFNFVGLSDPGYIIGNVVPALGNVFGELFLGVPLPPQIYLFGLCYEWFSILGTFNHVYMHKRTHGIAVPAVVAWMQDLGILPHPKVHQLHHTPPHDQRFEFLVGFGGSSIVDYLGSPYLSLTLCFWLFGPMSLVATVAVGLWYAYRMREETCSVASDRKMA